jgi:hypothetical protein
MKTYIHQYIVPLKMKLWLQQMAYQCLGSLDWDKNKMYNTNMN